MHMDLDPEVYYRNYFDTYVQRDVRQMIQVKDLRTFSNFVRLCAGRIGQNFNASEIGNNLGVSSHTVKAWLSVLEASYVIYLMEPFSGNIGKRLVKAPKLYFQDVGLAAYLLGFSCADRIFSDRMRGPLFENMVVMELVKMRYNRNRENNLFFYRDSRQHEVDVMMANEGAFDCLEIKSSATFSEDFLKGISYLRRSEPELVRHAYLVYAGTMLGMVRDVQLLNYESLGDALGEPNS
jgi:predicted AAA+ superfamily ATPase